MIEYEASISSKKRRVERLEILVSKLENGILSVSERDVLERLVDPGPSETMVCSSLRLITVCKLLNCTNNFNDEKTPTMIYFFLTIFRKVL